MYDQRIDLSDERGINSGVKIVQVNIATNKKNYNDNVNTSMYSPMFLFTLIIVFFQWEYVSAFIKFVKTPVSSMRKLVFGSEK